MKTENIMAEAWAKTDEAAVMGAAAGAAQGLIVGSLGGATGGMIGMAAGAANGANNEEMQANLMKKKMDMAEFMESDAGKWVGGLAGAATGAATGAALGSIIPGIGTIVGSVVGGVVGAVAGATAGPTVEEVEREQTGGLTYDEFNSFAALAAERGVSMAEGSSKEEFKDLYLEMGYDEATFDSVWASMQNMGTSFDELANSAMAVKAAEEARVDAIASTVAQSSELVQSSEHAAVAEEAGAQAFTDYNDRVAEAASGYSEDLDDKNLDSAEAEAAL